MKKVLLVIVMLLFICGCDLVNVVDEAYITNYLNNKYGDDIEFKPMYTSSCKIYEAGTCRASYTSSLTGENEIHIIWNEKDGSDIRDDFLFLKYDKELKDYYNKIINNAIDYRFKVSEITNKSDYKWEKNLELKDFINYENLNSGIAINIIDNEGEDLNILADSIKRELENNKINNVASLYITAFNSGCNLDNVDSCKKVNSIYYEVKIVEFYDENAKKS